MAVGVNTRIVWYILNCPVHNKVVYGKPSDSHLLFCTCFATSILKPQIKSIHP